jgi:hypothetical protein
VRTLAAVQVPAWAGKEALPIRFPYNSDTTSAGRGKTWQSDWGRGALDLIQWPPHRSVIQSDRKTGTFVKQIQIESMQQQTILLTVIEPLQLAN